VDLISLGIVGVLLALGLFIGGYRERKHFKNLELRERAMAGMQVTQLKSFPFGTLGSTPPCLMIAEVVVATDYLKSFLAGIRNIFGGEIRSYERLLVRARREALLRIVEQARASGYNAVCNVRLEPADIGGNATDRRVAMVAIFASGTAYHATPVTP
jgi:uncharacterized protein YbjQ (UPF0145 family)